MRDSSPILFTFTWPCSHPQPELGQMLLPSCIGIAPLPKSLFAVISPEVTGQSRWKSTEAWNKNTAFSVVLFAFPSSPAPIPLLWPLLPVVLPASNCLGPLILEVRTNLVPFMVSVGPSCFPPTCLTLLAAALNAQCHLTTVAQSWEFLSWPGHSSWRSQQIHIPLGVPCHYMGTRTILLSTLLHPCYHEVMRASYRSQWHFPRTFHLPRGANSSLNSVSHQWTQRPASAVCISVFCPSLWCSSGMRSIWQQLRPKASGDMLLANKEQNNLFLFFPFPWLPLLVSAGFLSLLCLESSVVSVFMLLPRLSHLS